MSMAPNSFNEKIVNVETGEITYREYTSEEIAQVLKEKEESDARAKEISEKENLRKTALSKLIDLGLTEEEIAAL